MATELYLLEIHGTHTSEYWQNNLYFEGDNLAAGDVIVNARDLLSNWLNNAESGWIDMLPSSVAMERLVARRVDVAGGISIVHQYIYNNTVGNVDGNASSQQLCPVVRLIPPNGVKSASRFFLPAIAEDDISNNSPSAGWVTRLATLMNVMIGGMSDGSITWTQAIYSRKLNQYHKAMDFDTSPIIDYASRHFDCQLDRKQANTLRQLQKAMDVRGERLNNGKRVVTKIDTLRRVLEVIAEAKP